MGLYWKSIIVKVTGCDYITAGQVEKLVDALCPNCSEAQLIQEAPVAYNALRKLDSVSRDVFEKSYDNLSPDEFHDLYEILDVKIHPSIRFAA